MFVGPVGCSWSGTGLWRSLLLFSGDPEALSSLAGEKGSIASLTEVMVNIRARGQPRCRSAEKRHPI
jgi:hypothetical protein